MNIIRHILADGKDLADMHVLLYSTVGVYRSLLYDTEQVHTYGTDVL